MQQVYYRKGHENDIGLQHRQGAKQHAGHSIITISAVPHIPVIDGNIVMLGQFIAGDARECFFLGYARALGPAITQKQDIQIGALGKIVAPVAEAVLLIPQTDFRNLADREIIHRKCAN